jgi:hypothetical protein
VNILRTFLAPRAGAFLGAQQRDQGRELGPCQVH